MRWRGELDDSASSSPVGFQSQKNVRTFRWWSLPPDHVCGALLTSSDLLARPWRWKKSHHNQQPTPHVHLFEFREQRDRMCFILGTDYVCPCFLLCSSNTSVRGVIACRALALVLLVPLVVCDGTSCVLFRQGFGLQPVDRNVATFLGILERQHYVHLRQ